MTRYRKCSAKDLQNRLQFINRHLETLNVIKRGLLEECELRMDSPAPRLEIPSAPPALVRQIATRPPSPEVLKGTPPHIEEITPTSEVPIVKPVLQFLEDPTEAELEPDKPEGVEGVEDKPGGFEDNISLASNEINNIEQELKESLEKLSLAKMKKTLSRSKPKII